MENEFRILITGRQQTVVKLFGPLTEKAEFHLINVGSKLDLEIDLGSTTSINSIGIRAFKEWMARIENKVLMLSFVPRFFVDQINMVVGLLPAHARVASFYVPYYSEETGEERQVLYTRGIEFWRANNEVHLAYPKVNIGSPTGMAMDVNEHKYFAFLDRHG